MTAIQPQAQPNGALATGAPKTLAERYNLTDSQLALVKNQVAPGAPDDVLELYFVRCRQLGFDPLSKMLFAIPRGGWKKDASGNFVMQNGRRVWDDKGSWTFQTSIDGFRSIAESAEGYAGQDGPYWCGEDGEWKDVWLKKDPPRAAKVGIIRHGFAQPLFAVATLEEYAQRDKDGALTGLWPKMPAVMLAKCAEALALRKAFPQRLAGVYANEEMTQAENDRQLPAARTTRTTRAVKGAATVDESQPALPSGAEAAAENEDQRNREGAEQTLEPPTEADLGARYAQLADPKTLKAWLLKQGIDLRGRALVNGRVVLTIEERRTFNNALQALEIEQHGKDKPPEPVDEAQIVEETKAQLGLPTGGDDGLDEPCPYCHAAAGELCAPDCPADEDEAPNATEAPDGDEPPEGFDTVELPEGDSTRNQRAQIGILCQDLGISDALRHKLIWKRHRPKHSAKHLTKQEAREFIDELKAHKKERDGG